jgi:hypothetical protein
LGEQPAWACGSCNFPSSVALSNDKSAGKSSILKPRWRLPILDNMRKNLKVGGEDE